MTSTPLPLTPEALEPSKSKDELSVSYEQGWSEMRSGRAGRPMHCYTIHNLTKGTVYSAELFETDEGDPFGWCDCPAGVICKHIRGALKDLRERKPEFGKRIFEGETT